MLIRVPPHNNYAVGQLDGRNDSKVCVLLTDANFVVTIATVGAGAKAEQIGAIRAGANGTGGETVGDWDISCDHGAIGHVAHKRGLRQSRVHKSFPVGSKHGIIAPHVAVNLRNAFLRQFTVIDMVSTNSVTVHKKCVTVNEFHVEHVPVHWVHCRVDDVARVDIVTAQSIEHVSYPKFASAGSKASSICIGVDKHGGGSGDKV